MEMLNGIFDTYGFNGLWIALACLAGLVVVVLGVWVTWRDRRKGN